MGLTLIKIIKIILKVFRKINNILSIISISFIYYFGIGLTFLGIRIFRKKILQYSGKWERYDEKVNFYRMG